VRLNASRGSEQYQSMAWSYVRWTLLDVKLFSTADFVCSRSGRARDRFGGLLFLRCLGILGGVPGRLQSGSPQTPPLAVSEDLFGRQHLTF
jgi:hypothetical protein